MADDKKKKRTILDFYQCLAPKKVREDDKDVNNNQLKVNATISQSTARDDTPATKQNEPPFPHTRKSESTPSTSKAKAVRSFKQKWLKEFEWLNYDSKHDCMTCILCLKHKKTNVIMTGSKFRNCKTSTLTRHTDSTDHKQSVVAEAMTGSLQKTVPNVFNEKESCTEGSILVSAGGFSNNKC